MSIRSKLSWFITLTVTVILILNISIYYFSSKSELQSNAEQQMLVIAKQIGQTMDAAQQSRQLIEATIGEKLRIAAIAAKNKLDPDITKVTNEELVRLSQELGVDQISLWERTEDDIVITKSSDPSEINLGSRTMDYWYTAFKQLFDKHQVSISKGQSLDHFWSGPINFAASDPSEINKWGYYHDGTTNYMINPYVHAKIFLDFEKINGSEAMAEHVLRDNRDIVSITGYDPEFVGTDPIIKYKKGQPVYNLDVRSIIFGDDSAIRPSEVEAIKHAAETGETVKTKVEENGRELLKSYVPIIGQKTFVIGISFNSDVIQQSLTRQLLIQSAISIGLILITALASSFLASLIIRSLNQILIKVNEIAQGNFGARIAIKSYDEMGLLASRVNTMSYNLQTYMTRLKDAAEELRDTKQYLESFVNHTTDAIHVSALDGTVIQVNQAFEKIYGWSEEEMLGNRLDNIPEEYREEFESKLKIVLAGGSVTDHETVRYDKDGQSIDVSMTISSIRDEQGEIVAIAAITRNITARKQTEEVLRRSEKLSVVGQLAAGVAHEVRNPLTTLRGFVQLMQKDGKLAPAYYDIMLSELDRINFIVSEFLVFAKPQASRYQFVDMRVILRDIVMLLDSEANINNVRIETHMDDDIPPLRCEVNQLKQVLVNVLKNGMEAMPDGGVLTVALLRAAEGDLLIRITDEGVGIAEQDMARLCEPFFTRKDEGTGLGLMVSQQIIDNHKGSMKFESELGHGTRVEIRLPLPPMESPYVRR
ncbi:PAS domain S-box protein [Paenibacillus sp. NPDC058071]|uniref:PAS domain S-box protein n=1 Tax=Paenibacillus sp. NPDC058071 TaxID=3346326 RepID=UPI0036DB2322